MGEYLKFQRIMDNGAIKEVDVSPSRVMGIIGGPASARTSPVFKLELTNRAGALSHYMCAGKVDDVREMFNRFGIGQSYLWYVGVANPLTNLRHGQLQLSAVYIPRIAELRRLAGGRKAKTAISRNGLPPLLAREKIEELAGEMYKQGYKGSGVQNPNIFILHPDFMQAAPPKPAPSRKARLKDPLQPQKEMF